MRTNCNDPECPANKQLASTSKPRKTEKHKRRRPSCHKDCPTTSTISIKPQKTSKYARSKKRSKQRLNEIRTSKIKLCKNKKCQASNQYVESSTSIYTPEKICVRSKEPMRLCRLPCQDLLPARRPVCKCQPLQNVPEKKKEKKRCRLKKYKRQTKLSMPLCICVRTSSLENFRRNKHPRSRIIEKNEECCCIKRGRSRKRNETSIAPRKDLEKNSCYKCYCTPSPTSSRSQQNIFLRGLSFFCKKMAKFKRSSSDNPEPNRLRLSRSYPVESCCSRSCLKKRTESSPEKRKVKFYK